MVNAKTINRIQGEFPWASWAIWDDDFPDGDCIENSPEKLVDLILDRSKRLTPDVVLMGLNRADDLDAPFENFHAPTRKHYDYRLKEFIQDGGLDRLQGAFMTDLVDEVNPDASKVQVTDEDMQLFLDQLRVLGQSEYHVVCFGNKPFDGLSSRLRVEPSPRPHEIKYAKTELDNFTLHVYRFWFYGLYGIYQSKVDTLQSQLQYLNDQIS